MCNSSCFFISTKFQFFICTKKGWDSTYYRKYKDRLIISYFQSYKNYSIDISQKLTKDSLGLSKITNIAESNLVSGFEINYDKLNISFGFRSPTPSRNQSKKEAPNTVILL